jgi:elongation factor Ts
VKLSVSPPAALGSDVASVLGKDLAMQVAAANPIAVDRQSIPADTVAKEKEIYFSQAQNSGKPEKVWEKIVDGKLAKFYQEVVLLEQAFIRDTNITVADRIKSAEKEAAATIRPVAFVRLELGAEEERCA